MRPQVDDKGILTCSCARALCCEGPVICILKAKCAVHRAPASACPVVYHDGRVLTLCEAQHQHQRAPRSEGRVLGTVHLHLHAPYGV